MRDFIVYEAGPITGCTLAEATEWRERLRSLLPPEIRLANPLRQQAILKDQNEIFQGGYDSDLYNNRRALTVRDRFDCMRADLVFVNFLGAKRVSIGTVCECAWADSHRIPLVIAMEADNIHRHEMITEMAGWVVPSLEIAAKVITHILLPEGESTLEPTHSGYLGSRYA